MGQDTSSRLKAADLRSGSALRLGALLTDREEENNRIGKTRDLFKKIRGTERTFHAKMGTINGRNGMDLTEAEDIKKRWQEYTEEL